MLYLYTGATTPGAVQNDIDLSLGGNVSSTPIPNSLDNLFDDISWMAIENRSVETKAYVIANNTNVDVDNYTIGYTYPANAIFKLEIAPVTLAGGTTMEKIGDSSSSPYYATFVEANIDPAHSINNSQNLGTIAAGTSLGIWIRRTIISDISLQVCCPVTCDPSPCPEPDDCCENLQIEINALKPTIQTVSGDFSIQLLGGNVLEWILFNGSTFPFNLKIGTTSGGNEILTVDVVDSQPVLIYKYTGSTQTIYFTGVPANSIVSIKVISTI
jgi:hypothetical protein